MKTAASDGQSGTSTSAPDRRAGETSIRGAQGRQQSGYSPRPVARRRSAADSARMLHRLARSGCPGSGGGAIGTFRRDRCTYTDTHTAMVASAGAEFTNKISNNLPFGRITRQTGKLENHRLRTIRMLLDPPDRPHRLTAIGQDLRRLRRMFRRHHDHHPDPAVEHPVHFVLGHPAF